MAARKPLVIDANGRHSELVLTDALSAMTIDTLTLTGVPVAPTAAVSTNTTQIATTAFVVGQAATVAPVIDGTAAVGTSLLFARQDHVHPTDTSRAALASPTFTGAPLAPTATVSTNTAQIATTAFVLGQAATATPAALGTATVGTSLLYARQDHVHAAPTAASLIATPAAAKTGAYTLAQTDNNNTILVNVSSTVAVTAPQLTAGTVISVCQTGTAAVTWTAGTGVTINTFPSGTTGTGGQYAVVTFFWMSTTSVLVFGSTA